MYTHIYIYIYIYFWPEGDTPRPYNLECGYETVPSSALPSRLRCVGDVVLLWHDLCVRVWDMLRRSRSLYHYPSLYVPIARSI